MTEGQIEPATLELIYEVTRQGPPHQFQEGQALDAKIVQVFAAASVVIGLAGVAPDAVIGFLVLAIMAYIVVAAASLWGIWVRKTKRPFHTDSLLEEFWENDVYSLRYALAYELPSIYKYNQVLIDNKAIAARVAILATAIEVLAVGGMVIWVA